ncbi:MAG: hypothetical protein JRH20_10345 [Deltaproteobacteria bacterium]|nr:hypothetical protein [Deltaproteobacteria bacterium]
MSTFPSKHLLGVLPIFALLWVGCTADERVDPVAALHLRTEARAHLDPLEEGADLRPVAKNLLEVLRLGGWQAARDLASPETTITPFDNVPLPATIRVWRRSQCSTGSCSCPVDEMPLEEYVKGVVPHEWIASWEMPSLQAGAIAVRTYAASWVTKGGKYDCADVCDTTYTQVYKDERNDRGNEAVDATRDMVLIESGQLVFAEYSAENGDPTAFGVVDPLCAGKTVQGHGRGMCQWGSQRWALENKDFQWIATHYYPGSELQGGAVDPPIVDPPICTPTGPEICDAVDNNCDGEVDEGDPSGGAYCVVPGTHGVCAVGVTRCEGEVVCQPIASPQAETCNNYDDDCDGVVDNVIGGCAPACDPRPEICNGQDDDCDEETDEGNPQGGQPCHLGGSCPLGVTMCADGIIVCEPVPQLEICDGRDNDCNGYVDDVPGGCTSTNAPPPCTPVNERCNGLDDDCDGFPDEGNPEGGMSCAVSIGTTAFDGITMCLSGQLICQVEDPGTDAFSNSVDELRGKGCAFSGGSSDGLPSLVLVMFLLGAWRWGTQTDQNSKD